MSTKLRGVVRVIEAQETSDGAGVRLRRSLGLPGFDFLDPFLLLDEFKSDSSSDYIAGFPDHPHRGFETVTYMLAGSMEHRDSKGNQGILTDGSIQWMTAGKGIIHSEMPKQKDGLMWGFQLWVNLPASDKMREPRYQDIPSEQIPEVEPGPGVRVKVIAGESRGTEGPVRGVVTKPLYLDVHLAPHAAFDQPVPSGHSAFVYAYEGGCLMGDPAAGPDGEVQTGQLAVLSEGEAIRATALTSGARFLLIAARPLKEPMVRSGPFVMNTNEELRQAFEDYRKGSLTD